MRYFDCEQGSEAWFKLRLGVPTASNFRRILTPKQAKLSASADEYINELVGEQLSLIPPEGAENYTNRAMRWGQQTEEEARRFYCMENSCDVQNGGFCTSNDGRFGSSPDFLVGIEPAEEMLFEPGKGHYALCSVQGAGELKCPQPATQVEYLLADALPDIYRWQVHGHLIVTGAAYCDFLSYTPGLAPLVVRVEPGSDTLLLRQALDQFWDKYQLTLRRVREMNS